jgi:hypothetical protein
VAKAIDKAVKNKINHGVANESKCWPSDVWPETTKGKEENWAVKSQTKLL